MLCLTEHEHRSRAVADDVLRGRFTVAGASCELGPEPDWMSAHLPADEEWRIEWVKFGWGLDLAHAAAETGDRAYADAWERLTDSWMRRAAPDADSAEVTARRILNWIYAWQRLAPSAEHQERLRDSLAQQMAHVRANLAPRRNHRTLELYALLVAALALPSLAGEGLLEETIAELDRNLASDFHPDGVHREASTHYHAIALRSFAGARANARIHGVELPDGFDGRLARACAFAAHCTRPDGTIPALSDADSGDYGRLLELAADLLGNEELRWVGTKGGAGRRPATTDVGFPDGGYHVQRSGWDRDARFLIFDCGPLGEGGHGHYDLLSFEAHDGPRPLVLDPGRGSYSEGPPNLRQRFRSTAAHNTVCVDGLDQTPYTRGRPRGPVAAGRLLYRDARTLAAEARSPCYDAVHMRRIDFVDGGRWRVEDELSGHCEHRYDLRFHLPPGRGAPRGRNRAGAGARADDLGSRDDRPRAGPAGAALRRVRGGAGGERQRKRCAGSLRLHHGAHRRRAMNALLAPDPAVAQRDVLLDERVMGSLLGTALTGVEARRCERANTKYRVGDSLRVVYRLEAGDTRHTVAGRTFPGRSESVYRRAAAAALPIGTAPAVVHAAELETVFWTFPNDRRLTALRTLADGSLERMVGVPGLRVRLVAYAAERGATVCCERADEPVAYVKLHRDAAGRELRLVGTASHALGTRDPDLRLPAVLGARVHQGALALEPLPGRRLDTLAPAEQPAAFERLGAALGRLHRLTPPARSFERVEPERLQMAATLVGRARPDGQQRGGGAAGPARPPPRRGRRSACPPPWRHQPAQCAAGRVTGRAGGPGGRVRRARGGGPRFPARPSAHAARPGRARRGERGDARRGAAVRLREAGTRSGCGRAALAHRRRRARPHRRAGRGARPAGDAGPAARPARGGREGAGMSTRPALLFYCQHSVGLGHLARSYVLCAALRERFRVVLLCSGPPPDALRPPAGVQVVTLPPLGVGPDGAFASLDPAFTLDEAWAARRARMLATLRAVQPALLIVELFPFGRARFRRELVPLLDAAAAIGAVRICSLRDILVTRRADQRRHDERAAELANAHLDAVLVHSDPSFARLEETFAPRTRLRVPVHYTGFVVEQNGRPRPRGAHVVVSAGGGRVGEPLLSTAARAQPLTGMPMRLIGGPLLPAQAWRRIAAIAPPGVELRRSVQDLGAELSGARASVSQGGYNTALEVVRSGIPALIVPYATGEEDEQTRRARRLEHRGAVRVLHADQLAPAPLAAEIRRLAGFRPQPAGVDLGGAARSAALLEDLVAPRAERSGRA